MKNKLVRLAAIFSISFSISACGTYTPKIQEFWGDSENAAAMEALVAGRIACELGKAINGLYDNVKDNEVLWQDYKFFFKWIVQTTLTFTVDEQSTISATPSFISKLHPLAAAETFTLGLSGSHKNQATRVDKVTLTYKVTDFIGAKQFSCENQGFYKGTLFLQSDLKIEEWLSAALNVAVAQGGQSQVTAHPRFNAKPEAIQHDVKFLIVSAGGISPTWKLVDFANGANPLVAAQRDRAQQLLVTMGPPNSQDPDALGPAAQASALASQINAAINPIGRVAP
jgi:hypothetical protein